MDGEPPTPAEAEKLEQVKRWLIKRGAQVAAPVIRMGRVRFTDIVDTAGVRVTGPDVDLFFNREFFASLKLVELTAVLLHEALHVVFKHQARAERIPGNWDRRLFGYGCEAVINDTITRYFPEVTLPGEPVTGQRLIGRDASRMSADQILEILRERSPENESALSGDCLDDHDVWDPGSGDGESDSDGESRPRPDCHPPRWNEESEALIRHIRDTDPEARLWGSEALGAGRLPPRSRNRTDLKRFLLEQMRPAHRYATNWSRPNRKAMAIYPEVLLPVYDPESWFLRVLMAIDASGSVSDEFLGVARAVAGQQLPGTRIRLISFDTHAYEADLHTSTLCGGGGTDAGAVERYILEHLPAYPDHVFLFTDGYTPFFQSLHPDRWIWLLPPHGSAAAVPEQSRVHRFDPAEFR